MKKKFVFSLFSVAICFLLFSPQANSQETLSPLNKNYTIKQYLKKQPNAFKRSAKVDTIKVLPFFDDFSDLSSIYPNQTKWIDKDAFINSNFPDNPPTIGVATLDAINAEGNLIPTNSDPTKADKLTSAPINLDNPAYQNLYLSFWYQPQGKALTPPEEKDSLFVEFYAPNQKKWTKVWEIAGKDNQAFQAASIAITDTAYLQKGFAFRFRNIVSLRNSTNPSLSIDDDYWHIDYVVLDKDRTSTVTIEDVAFVNPLGSFIKKYEAIPYKHISNFNDIVKDKVEFIIKNNGTATRTLNNLDFNFKNESTSAENNLSLGSQNAAVGDNKFEITNFGSSFPQGVAKTDEEVTYKVTSTFQTNTSEPTVNNTVSHYQKFSNYYAYDDGTAEFAYGISGEGAKYSSVAYRFENMKEDTLRAVDFYFTKSLNNVEEYFLLTIWDEKDGKPNKIIYQQSGDQANYSGIGNFQRCLIDAEESTDTIAFPTSPKIPAGNFYVGWVQTSNNKLNVGFDVNRNTNDTGDEKKILYNISGIWQTTSLNGALMIRPVLGSQLPNIATNDFKFADNEKQFSVYPNPARDRINIVSKDNTNISEINIYSISGKLIKTIKNSKRVDLNDISSGMYWLILSNEKYRETHKIIVLP